jgi:hypothetical protein
MERKNGLAPLPAGILRPTTRPDAGGPIEEHQGDDSEGQGRGEAAPAGETRAPKPRQKRTPVGGETKGRKLNLPDSVYDRLQLLAIQRRTTASAIAAEILDRNLPRLRIEREV